MGVRSAVACLVVAMSTPGCDRAPAALAWCVDLGAAARDAAASGRLLAVHFRVPGRPLVDEMAATTFTDPDVVRLAVADFVHVGLEAADAPELFERAVGGRTGLATCVLDPAADLVAVLPGYAGAVAYRGFLELARERRGAIARLRQAVADAEAAPGPPRALADALLPLGCRNEALALLERSFAAASDLESASDAACAAERLARIEVERGRNLAARRWIELCRAFDPELVHADAARLAVTEALILCAERRPSDAVDVLESALTRHPGSAESGEMRLVLGLARHDSGDDAGAVATLEALVRDPSRGEVAARARAELAHVRSPDHGHRH
jgi:tetratricopeptide (TPR) repeat protein